MNHAYFARPIFWTGAKQNHEKCADITPNREVSPAQGIEPHLPLRSVSED